MNIILYAAIREYVNSKTTRSKPSISKYVLQKLLAYRDELMSINEQDSKIDIIQLHSLAAMCTYLFEHITPDE